jgi:hypothetical protein
MWQSYVLNKLFYNLVLYDQNLLKEQTDYNILREFNIFARRTFFDTI